MEGQEGFPKGVGTAGEPQGVKDTLDILIGMGQMCEAPWEHKCNVGLVLYKSLFGIWID
jgi:hypothetical protein